MKVAQKGLIVVAVPLLFELAFIGVLSFLLVQAGSQLQYEIRSRQTITVANKLMLQLAEAASLGAAYTVLHDRKLPVFYESNREAVVRSLHLLENSTSHNPEQAKRVRTISKDVLDLLEGYKILFEKPELLTSTLYKQDRPDVKDAVDKVGTCLHEISTDEERSALASLAARHNQSWQLRLVLAEGLVLDLALTSLLFIFFFRGISQRLEQVRANMDGLAAREALKPQLSGDDEIAEIDANLHVAGARLAKAEAKKSNAIALVKEELKTPLTSISRMLAELLSAAELSSKASNRLSIAQSSMSRLLRLIDELLSFGTPTKEKFSLSLAPVSLNSLIEQAADAVSGLASERQIKIRTDVVERMFDGDADHLQQILINLLSNAIKHSPPGSTVQLNGTADDAIVKIEVVDRGRGIARQDQKRIFEPFAQSRQEDAKTGSGLGLAICREIVELHGGKIDVESEPGKGSRFWIELPTTGGRKCGRDLNAPVRRSLSRQGTVIILLPVITMLALIGFLSIALAELDKDIEEELRASEKMALIHGILNGSAKHGTLLAAESIRHNPERERIIVATVAAVDDDLEMLRELSGDAQEIKMVDHLEEQIKTLRNYHAKGMLAGKDLSLTMRSVGMFGLAKNLAEMKKIANEFGARSKEHEEQGRTGRLALVQTIKIAIPVLTLTCVVITMFCGIQFMNSISTRLLRLRDNAERLYKGQTLLPPLPGDDEIAQLDQFFYATAARLKELEEFRNQVIGITSHELKSPLQTVQNVFYSLKAGMFGELSGKSADLAHRADLGVRLLIRLVNDLLDIQKMGLGKLAIDPARTPMSELCEEAVALASQVDGRRVSLSSRSDDVVVELDRGRMLSVLVVLLTNLARNGASSICLEAKVQDGNLILNAVADGISREPGCDVLERFAQDPGILSSWSHEPGTLGADSEPTGSLSRSVLKAHGGSAEIRYENQAVVCRLSLPALTQAPA